MASLMQCDRCKTTTDVWHGWGKGAVLNSNGVSIKESDLCQVCLEKLKYWLETPPPESA